MHKGAKTQKFMSFELGELIFAIPLSNVCEVTRNPSFVSVPNVPPYFLGILNFRGQVHSVFDLANKFELKSKFVLEKQFTVIVEYSDYKSAFKVDHLKKILDISWKEIEFEKDREVPVHEQYLCGRIHRDSEVIHILDLEQCFYVEGVESRATSGVRS